MSEDLPRIGAMRQGVAALFVMATATACGSLPWSDPERRGECREVLDSNFDVQWAGYGHLVELGLLERGVPGGVAGPGDIWVGIASGELAAPQGERVFCLLAETPDGDVVNADLVPDGRQPP